MKQRLAILGLVLGLFFSMFGVQSASAANVWTCGVSTGVSQSGTQARAYVGGSCSEGGYYPTRVCLANSRYGTIGCSYWYRQPNWDISVVYVVYCGYGPAYGSYYSYATLQDNAGRSRTIYSGYYNLSLSC